jgi:hypothetical protein
MIVSGLAAALFTIILAGCGVTMSIFARDSRINLIECACLSWLFGCGIVSLLLWIFGALCSGLLLQLLVAIACLLVAIVGWRARRKTSARFTLPQPGNIFEWVLASIIVIEIAVLIFVSFKHTLGWDGLLNWELKGRYAFLNGGIIPASYFSSPGRAFSHPEYPLGIPFTELWLYLWMGEPNQFWVKIIFPLFYAACAPLLALLISRLSGKRWIGLLVAALLPFVPSISASPGGIVVGYVDVPLSVFYLAALGYLLLWFRTTDSRFMMVFAACSAFLPWTKSEGVILWLVLVLVGFSLSFVKRRLALFSIAIVPGLLVIFSWRVFLRVVHLWPHSDFAHPSFSLARDNIGRLRDIFGILFAELSETFHWSIFWLMAAAAIVYLFASRKLERIALASAVIVPILLYSLIYVFSTWSSYSAHMTSSIPRLLLHVMPAAWLAIGLALSQSKRETQTF